MFFPELSHLKAREEESRFSLSLPLNHYLDVMRAAEYITNRTVADSAEAYASATDWGIGLLYLGMKENFLNPSDSDNFLAVRSLGSGIKQWRSYWPLPQLFSTLQQPLLQEKGIPEIAIEFNLSQSRRILINKLYAHLKPNLLQIKAGQLRESLLLAPLLMGAQLTAEAARIGKQEVDFNKPLEWVWGRKNGEEIRFIAGFNDKIRL